MHEEMMQQMTEGNPTAGMALWSSWLIAHTWIDEGRGSKNLWDEFTLKDAKKYT